MDDKAETAETGEQEIAQTLLGELLENSRAYRGSKEYRALLDFAVGMRNFAPFNAILLHLQRPGLRFAASAYDWRRRYDRTLKEGAWPLIILWPFGPVALVYDVADTDGPDLPEGVAHAFWANGQIDARRMARFAARLAKKGIDLQFIAYGDGLAGFAQAARMPAFEVGSRSKSEMVRPEYRVRVNAKHEPDVQFATLAHELAHLYLGHLGPDRFLEVPERSRVPHEQKELEAESVSYLICRRNGVESKAEQYLADYVQRFDTVERMDLDAILRSAGQVELVLKLGGLTGFGPKNPKRKGQVVGTPSALPTPPRLLQGRFALFLCTKLGKEIRQRQPRLKLDLVDGHLLSPRWFSTEEYVHTGGSSHEPLTP